MTPSTCSHSTLLTASSPFSIRAGYTQPTLPKRLAATTSSGRAPKENFQAPSPWTFPAPLALPGEELAYEPLSPPQSFRSWRQEKERNRLTPERRTVYVAPFPRIDDDDEFIRDWTRSPLLDESEAGKLLRPRTEDVIDYLKAFYHPLPVRALSTPFRLTAWDAAPPKKSRSAPSFIQHIALAHGDEATRIRVRKQPAGEAYIHQLNLDDILDGVIAAVPDDGYSLLLLAEHDLYEGDDDDFCCGRAYGGSRVAVVTSARYHPGLDAAQGLKEGRAHAWPASRCAEYVRQVCEDEEHVGSKKKAKSKVPASSYDDSEPQPLNNPLQLAMNAVLSPPSPPSPPKRILELLYLSRFALTASHELGHTFGLDHCVYYACLMSAAASLAEDMRGAPYLCPICSAKIGAAGIEADEKGAKKKKDLTIGQNNIASAELERCKRLRTVCARWVAGDMFRAFVAWLSARIIELEEELDLLNVD